MDSISRLSSSSALWLAKRSSVSQPESGSSSVEISKQSQCDNDSARKDEPQDLLLGEEYEAALVLPFSLLLLVYTTFNS